MITGVDPLHKRFPQVSRMLIEEPTGRFQRCGHPSYSFHPYGADGSQAVDGREMSRTSIQRVRPFLSIFSTCKPFEALAAVQQRNAILSWTFLRPRPDVILLGEG